MSITFRYLHIRRKDGTLKEAPYIPVFLRNKDNKLIRLAGLLDSGADNTIVPEDLAKILGLKEEKNSEDETKGIGGKVRTAKSRLHLRVKNERESYILEIPVLILKDDSSNVPLLLGRQGFFEHFDITFRQNEKKIVLKKANKKKYYK